MLRSLPCKSNSAERVAIDPVLMRVFTQSR